MFNWLKARIESRHETALARDVQRLQTELNETRATLEAEQRRGRVKDAELESLAAVIARDRERVKAEAAIASRHIAEAESTSSAELEGLTNGRFSASAGV